MLPCVIPSIHKRATTMLGLLILAFAAYTGFATAQNLTLYRSYWNPTFRGIPINYCLKDDVSCGMKVANPFCQMMGYRKADHIVEAYNLGHTRYLGTARHCINYRCNGFKTIRCVGKILHIPMPHHLYTKRRFYYPRYLGERVDFCMRGKPHACGKPAAYSFCRRMGYMKTIGSDCETHVAITKAIDNQRLCVGPECEGFRYIDCGR